MMKTMTMMKIVSIVYFRYILYMSSVGIPVRHSHRNKQSPHGVWNFGGTQSKQSIVSIAAAVAASPGKHLITRSSLLGSPTLPAWKEKEAETVVEQSLSLYNRSEDRLTEMRMFLDRRTGRNCLNAPMLQFHPIHLFRTPSCQQRSAESCARQSNLVRDLQTRLLALLWPNALCGSSFGSASVETRRHRAYFEECVQRGVATLWKDGEFPFMAHEAGRKGAEEESQ